MKTFRFFILMVMPLVFLLFLNYYSNPPDGYTGAPLSNEFSCTLCHNYDYLHINGDIHIKGIPTKIVPGKTYPVKVIVRNFDGQAKRTSFQLVAIHGEKSTGLLSNPKGNVAFSEYKERIYVESQPGVLLDNNKTVFRFDWQAPQTPDNAIISFYATSVLANGDNTFAYDKVIYTEAHGILGNSLDVLIAEKKDNTCLNDSAGYILINSAGGEAPYTYIWNNGETTKDIYNLKAGDYYVTVTDKNGLKGIGYAYISQPEELKIDSIAKKDITSSHKGSIEINITGGTKPYDFTWIKDNEVFSTEQNIYDLDKGCYNLIVEDSCGTRLDSIICIDDLSATRDLEAQFSFNIFPNPVYNNLMINSTAEMLEIQITSINGNKTSTFYPNGNNISIDISSLIKGIYFIKIKTKKGIAIRRIVKI